MLVELMRLSDFRAPILVDCGFTIGEKLGGYIWNAAIRKTPTVMPDTYTAVAGRDCTGRD